MSLATFVAAALASICASAFASSSVAARAIAVRAFALHIKTRMEMVTLRSNPRTRPHMMMFETQKAMPALVPIGVPPIGTQAMPSKSKMKKANVTRCMMSRTSLGQRRRSVAMMAIVCAWLTMIIIVESHRLIIHG